MKNIAIADRLINGQLSTIKVDMKLKFLFSFVKLHERMPLTFFDILSGSRDINV